MVMRPDDLSLGPKMKSLGYDPKELAIHAGNSVAWSNTSHTKHSATSAGGGKAFDTGEIKPGEMSSPVTFEKPGEVQVLLKNPRPRHERDHRRQTGRRLSRHWVESFALAAPLERN